MESPQFAIAASPGKLASQGEEIRLLNGSLPVVFSTEIFRLAKIPERKELLRRVRVLTLQCFKCPMILSHLGAESVTPTKRSSKLPASSPSLTGRMVTAAVKQGSKANDLENV